MLGTGRRPTGSRGTLWKHRGSWPKRREPPPGRRAGGDSAASCHARAALPMGPHPKQRRKAQPDHLVSQAAASPEPIVSSGTSRRVEPPRGEPASLGNKRPSGSRSGPASAACLVPRQPERAGAPKRHHEAAGTAARADPAAAPSGTASGATLQGKRVLPAPRCSGRARLRWLRGIQARTPGSSARVAPQGPPIHSPLSKLKLQKGGPEWRRERGVTLSIQHLSWPLARAPAPAASPGPHLSRRSLLALPVRPRAWPGRFWGRWGGLHRSSRCLPGQHPRKGHS